MDLIRTAYLPMRLLDLVQAIKSRSIPKKAVVVTFDDGYADNFTRALPILEAAQIPATVFVAAGHIDSKSEFWWDELSRLILAPPTLPPTLSLNLEGECYTISTESMEQRRAAYAMLDEVIKPRPADIQNSVLEAIARWSGHNRILRDEYRTMTNAELKQLANSKFIEIGAHTMNHPILPTLSPAVQREEVVNSRRCLQEILNQPIKSFAYPNGDFSDTTVDIVETAGFSASCTTMRGCVVPQDNPLKLRRFAVNDWNIGTFRRNLESYFFVDSRM